MPKAGSCRVWIRQGGQAGDRDVLRHHPCLGAVGAPWTPESLKSSPSVLLSRDKSLSVPWPGQKWMQEKNLKPIASPDPASSLTPWDLGVVAGKGGKGKGDQVQITGLVIWEEKRRFKGEMTAHVSDESRGTILHDIFPTKWGSFRASGVKWYYFRASFYVNCFGLCLTQSPN